MAYDAETIHPCSAKRQGSKVFRWETSGKHSGEHGRKNSGKHSGRQGSKFPGFGTLRIHFREGRSRDTTPGFQRRNRVTMELGTLRNAPLPSQDPRANAIPIIGSKPSTKRDLFNNIKNIGLASFIQGLVHQYCSSREARSRSGEK